MAFWGVEVKPGKPFTHKHDDVKRRLHISMATLGFGTAVTKSTLQCNVGNRSPVYICSLYPGNSESLQLNLELEEVDQVVFSVIGPRSIHLCGYYAASARNTNIIDHSESYGEDIADTETERSDDCDEDECEDSFIDDGGFPEVFPPSISEKEEASHDTRAKGRKDSLRQLRKKYLPVDLDVDNCRKEKIIVDDSKHYQTKEIENEDSLPISSPYKNNKAAGRVLDQEMDDGIDGVAGGSGNKNIENGTNSIIETNVKTDDVLMDCQMHREAELSNHLVDPSTGLDVGDIKKLKRKKKGQEKETKSLCNDHSIKLENNVGDGLNIEKMMLDFVAGYEQHQQHGDDKETETTDKMLATSLVDHGQREKPKKKRKERSNKGNLVDLPQRNEHNTQQHAVNGDVNISANVSLPSAEMDHEKCRTKRKKKEQVNKGANVYNEDIIQEDKAKGDAAESHNLIHKCLEEREQHQKLANEKSQDDSAHDCPDPNLSEDRKVKKKKKESKNQGNVVVNSDMPVSVETEMMEEDRNKRDHANPSQVGTLSNGLVIQELEKGTKDGKIAASGKKISIYYTGKLKENGVVVDSNAGQAPFKFRLGKGEVIKGWDVGLEGMQVGEKRRLVIPPSMTSKSDEQSAKVPPNSWLVYDIELVKVH